MESDTRQYGHYYYYYHLLRTPNFELRATTVQYLDVAGLREAAEEGLGEDRLERGEGLLVGVGATNPAPAPLATGGTKPEPIKAVLGGMRGRPGCPGGAE